MFYYWIYWQWDATKGNPEDYSHELWIDLDKFVAGGYHY